MELNKIELSTLQFGELYTTNLVVVEQPKPGSRAGTPVLNAGVEELNKEPILYKGKNRKNLLWLVFEENHPYLSDEDFQFLLQVLEACKMNLDDIALVNLHQTKTSFEELMQNFKPVNILASAIPPSFLNAPQQFYTILSEESYRLFVTGSLQNMKADKTLKSKLWLGLKQILEI